MHAPLKTSEPEPVWDLARLYPDQGSWDEREYLALDTNRLIEFTDGYLEVLPMPTTDHQLIAAFLFQLLDVFVREKGLGLVLFEGTKVRIRHGMVRMPDLMFIAKNRQHRRTKHYYEGIDLAIEVVSEDPKDHERDWEDKRRDYAEAGIPEYWIVDPQLKKIVVLKLTGTAYTTHSEAGATGRVTSALLPGLEADAAAVWAAAEQR